MKELIFIDKFKGHSNVFWYFVNGLYQSYCALLIIQHL